MNSFAHALPFLDKNKCYSIGCAVPDWLGAVDRRCRVRKNAAGKFIADPDSLVAELAKGIVQHIDDDRWFHSGKAFTELNMVFALELREILGNEAGFRPGFLGHIIIELLLDGFLHETHEGKLDRFYEIVAESSPNSVQDAVNRMATRPTNDLAKYFSIFLRERYLYDYVIDHRLLYRLNHVLRRVKLNPVGDKVLEWVPSARSRVYNSATELLNDYSMTISQLS